MFLFQDARIQEVTKEFCEWVAGLVSVTNEHLISVNPHLLTRLSIIIKLHGLIGLNLPNMT